MSCILYAAFLFALFLFVHVLICLFAAAVAQF